MSALLMIQLPVTYTCPGLEPMQSQMGVLWDEADPAALELTFKNPDETVTNWTVARDVFADCLLSEPGPKFGGGDMTLERGVVSMFMTLQGKDFEDNWYSAGITFMTKPVLQLVQASLMCVPRGEVESEVLAAELEAFLDELQENNQ